MIRLSRICSTLVELRRRVGLLERKQLARRRALADVERNAAGDHEQVGADAGSPGVVLPGCSPQPYKALLNHLFGQSVVAERLHAEAIQAPAIPAVKLGHRGSYVPSGYLGYQLCLLGSAAVLGIGYRHRGVPPTRFLRRPPAERFKARARFFQPGRSPWSRRPSPGLARVPAVGRLVSLCQREGAPVLTSPNALLACLLPCCGSRQNPGCLHALTCARGEPRGRMSDYGEHGEEAP